MKLIENGVIGRQCGECKKLILYGSKFYLDKKENESYCFRCGKPKQER